MTVFVLKLGFTLDAMAGASERFNVNSEFRPSSEMILPFNRFFLMASA